MVRLQEQAGCDLVTDGELRRDNFYSFVAESSSGVRLMTLAEMLDVVEDKAGFERLLQTLDVPAYSISNAGRVPAGSGRREPLVLDDLRVRARLYRPPGQGDAARSLPADARDVRARGDARRVTRPRRSWPRTSSRLLQAEVRDLAARRRRLHPARRAGADRAGVFARADAHVHVRRARRAQRSDRGAGVRGVADQSGGRQASTACGRPARLPRQLEPRRGDAASRQLRSRWHHTSSG